MVSRFLAVLAAAAVIVVASLSAQPVLPATAKEMYKAFSVVSLESLEQSLNRNAVEGYRMVAIDSTARGIMTVLMKAIPPGNAPMAYEVVYGNWDKAPGTDSSSMAGLMNALANDGYRFVPFSVLPALRSWSAVVMEQDPGSQARYTYRIYSPVLMTSARLERNEEESLRAGFRAVFSGSTGGRVISLEEKRTDGGDQNNETEGTHHLIWTSAKDISKKLAAEGKQGYLPLLVTEINTGSSSPMNLLWSEKSTEPVRTLDVDNAIKNPDPRRPMLRELMEQINSNAEEGYRLEGAPVFVWHTEGAFLPRNVWTLHATMRASTGAARARYRFASGSTLADLVENVNSAAEQGFRPIGNGLMEDYGVVMEKLDAPAN
jgi:hypothetical protein